MEKNIEQQVCLKFCVSYGKTTSVKDNNIEKVKQIVLENRRVGNREAGEALNISYGSTEHIVVHAGRPNLMP